MELYNEVASMSVCRVNPGVTVFNDKLYVVGGVNDSGYLRSAEYYDPEKNVWMTIASMCKPREYPAVSYFSNIIK